jgi:hypothetical protein
MLKVFFVVSTLLLGGCSGKQGLIIEGTSECQNKLIGSFKYKNFVDINGFKFNEINCNNLNDEYQIRILADFVSKGGSPKMLKRLGNTLDGLSLNEVIDWWINDFQLPEAKVWSDLGVSPSWAKEAIKLGFTPREAKILMTSGIDISSAPAWDVTKIPVDFWGIWISEGFIPEDAKALTEEFELDSKIKIINYLSEEKFKALTDILIINSWVCSQYNKIGILQGLRFDSLEIVVRRKAINLDGYDTPRYTLFRPFEGDAYKLIRKATRIRGHVRDWAACPETILNKL